MGKFSTLRNLVVALTATIALLFAGNVFAMEPIHVGDTVVLGDPTGRVDNFVYQGNGIYRERSSGGVYKIDAAGQLIQRSDGMHFSPHEGQYPPSGKFVMGETWSHEYKATKNGSTTDLKRECAVVSVAPHMIGTDTVEAATINCTVETVVGFFGASQKRTHHEVRAPKDISALPLKSTISWPASGRNPAGMFEFYTTAINRASPPQISLR